VLRLLEHPFITEPYTGPNTRVKLPPREKLKQSVAPDGAAVDSVQPGQHEGAAAAAASSSVAADADADVNVDGALKPEDADRLEDDIAVFLRQEHEQLKNSTQIEQIKIKL
jgi:hypothetical protein